MPSIIEIGLRVEERAAEAALTRIEKAVRSTADTAESAGRRIGSSFESTAGHADNVASKGSQAAGAFSGLGGLAAVAGGQVGQLGNSMILAGVASQAAADAGDLLNVVTESTAGKMILSRAASIASTAATTAQAGAQRALNLAMEANPIGLVIAGLVLLAAVFVIAYKKSATFRAIVNGALGAVQRVAQSVVGFFTTRVPAAFNKITGAASSVIGWVKGHWPLLLAILTGPIGLAVLAINRNWDKITAGAKRMWDYVSSIPGKIRDAFSGIWDNIASGLESAINTVLGLPLRIPTINTHIPGVGTVGGQTLIPKLARGGIVVAGDNPSGIEAIVPLERAEEMGFGGRGLRIGQLIVQVPHGASNYDVGEYLVEKLRAFFDGGGTL